MWTDTPVHTSAHPHTRGHVLRGHGRGRLLLRELCEEQAWPPRLSFARQLAVEAGEPDGEGLERTQRVVVVQCEHVVCHTPKLHDDVVS